MKGVFNSIFKKREQMYEYRWLVIPKGDDPWVTDQYYSAKEIVEMGCPVEKIKSTKRLINQARSTSA